MVAMQKKKEKWKMKSKFKNLFFFLNYDDYCDYDYDDYYYEREK